MPELVEFTDAQIELVKRTICKPRDRMATNDELALFIGQCKRTGLDPFAGQIYAVFRWDGRAQSEKMGIQVSIDGQRVVAERTGRYAGQEGPFWTAKGGEWQDVWLEEGEIPAAAKVIVIKEISGQLVRTSGIAHWNEYAITDRKTGKLTSMWNPNGGKPALMLAKCAEALALRKAFPNDLSGLYVAEEMGRAETPTALPAFEERAKALEPALEPALDPTSGNGTPAAAPPESPPTSAPSTAPSVDEEGVNLIPLSKTGLDNRVVAILAGAGIHRVGQVRESTWSELAAIERFGDRSRDEVKKLADFFEFEIPEFHEQTGELEEEVRALWIGLGMSEEEINEKIANAHGNISVLQVLASAARARIAS